MLRKETSSHVMSRCRDCLLWGCGAFPVPSGIYQADRDLSCCFSNKVTHQREGINRARICTYHCGHDLKRLWTWLKVSSNYKRLSKVCFGMSSSCNYIQYTTGKHARTIQDTYKLIYKHKRILKLDNSKDECVCVCVWCLWAWIISKCKKTCTSMFRPDENLAFLNIARQNACLFSLQCQIHFKHGVPAAFSVLH